MFRLNKWYLDLVTPEGVAVICYAARLRWGPLHLRFASILVDAPGAPPREANSIRAVERPSVTGGELHWRSGPLDVDGVWRRRNAGIRETLLRDRTHAIRWVCRMPLADAEVRWGRRRFAGLGYVETIAMTGSPVRLPFRTLRWGRHLSPEHAVVWIEWVDGADGRWVWRDGVRQPDAGPTEAGTISLGTGSELRLGPSRVIRDQPVLPEIGILFPELLTRAVGALRSLRERRNVSRSTLYQDGRPLDEGWAVHEEVTW